MGKWEKGTVPISHFLRKMKKYYRLILLILMLIVDLCMIIVFYFVTNKTETIKDDLALKNYMAIPIVDDNSENDADEDNITEIPSEIPVIQKTERMLKIEALQQENSDIIGWLEIPNTNINYPVLQGKDNSYYMTHNYKKRYSKEGSLFLDKDYDWSVPSSNLLIYGHNNRGTNEMFCQLLDYKKESFYNSHKTIRFTTKDEDKEYEILSVFLSRVYYKSEKNVFRYYYFINANSKEEFDEYIENCKKASLYETGITAEYGEQLITLSTCDFYVKDGRLVVVAKKTNEASIE